MYVVLTGPPASGKSTLSRALAGELGLPLLAKDTIEQALLDELGAVDVHQVAERVRRTRRRSPGPRSAC